MQLKSYPIIPWVDPTLLMRNLTWCRNTENVLKMFRDVKLRSMKKTGGASASTSLTMSKRTEKVLKKTVEFEAQSWPPKKGASVGGTRKRGHKTAGENVGRLLLPSNSSDSISGYIAAPPCPMGTLVTEEDFSGDDIDKFGAGRSKWKKVDEDALCRRQSVRDLMQESHEALEELKAWEEAAEKAATRSPKVKGPKKCSREVARASRQAAEKASHEGADKGPRNHEGDYARLLQSFFRDPLERPLEKVFREPFKTSPKKSLRDTTKRAPKRAP